MVVLIELLLATYGRSIAGHLAGLLRRLEPRGVRVGAWRGREDETTAFRQGRIREVRHPVGPHAFGVPQALRQQLLLLGGAEGLPGREQVLAGFLGRTEPGRILADPGPGETTLGQGVGPVRHPMRANAVGEGDILLIAR
jgi:hypothetical protein